MKNQLFEWFQWNNAANESFIHAFQNVTTVPEKCIEILSHIINEHEIWLNRICAVNYPVIQAWQVEDEVRIAVRNATIHEITNNFLSSESYGGNFDWSFAYCNSNGESVNRSLGEVYFQILTYSEFHRGQVANLLKENGIEPPSTDYLSLKN
jgi:uncharacterized damage-inducible protein DinB